MSRCYYDTIFQRVFCVTLVAIALTFTVILTNVFVDIDGLLSSKVKSKSYDVPIPMLESEIRQVHVQNLAKPNTIYKEERNYEDNDENYRNKRSLETPNFLFHVKNPKMKSILTNRLATLLEELDEEESSPPIEPKEDHTKASVTPKPKEELNKDGLIAALKATGFRRDGTENKGEEDMLHLAMHNILLQGIIGHMDLNDVYKKVHSMLKSFKDGEEEEAKEKHGQERDSDKDQSDKEPFPNYREFIKPKSIKEFKRPDKLSRIPPFEENKFFEEMVKCDKLQNDITDSDQTKNGKNTLEPKEMRLVTQKGPGSNLLIKTIIDISSNKNKLKKEMNANSRETIKGIIKLIYNGKSVKFSRIEDEDNQQTNIKFEKPPPDVTPKNDNENLREETKNSDALEPQIIVKNKPVRLRKSNGFINTIINEYFNKYPKKADDVIDDSYNENFESKRLKRHIKIKYEDEDATTLSPKPKRINENEDDELFVEIETHFDSKGMKGDKKKKLIKSIIDKIQKAIHSDIDKINESRKKKHKHMQVKKRIQNPLEKDKKMLINKMGLHFDAVEQRHSEPISKTMSLPNPVPIIIADKSGENWKKAHFGPGFLTVSKSVNSAEMGEVDIDYNKILPSNGIPQRLQKPLNTDVSEEMLNANSYFDMGNLKFFVKNIDGTGLSIGFNQYTDEAPDPEAIKLFTGIEQLVKSYKNDGTQSTPLFSQDRMKTSMSEESEHQMSNRDETGDRNEHVMIRRSIKETRENDYHSNEYKIIFDNNFLPYNSYQEIYQDKKKRVALTINKETENINTYDRDTDNVEIVRKNFEIKEFPALMDGNNNLFYKKLKPAEILSLSSLLDRKKRSLNVHRITNLNKKIKINRYLNTRTKGRKNFILNKKRSKRQIDKIRIIATDAVNKPRHADDNIFFVNDENLLADRAIIREVETPEEVDVDDKMEEHYDMLPVMYEDSPYTRNVFDGKSRHNLLMAKYPHVFMEEVSKSKEEEDYKPIIFSRIGMKPGNHYGLNHENFVTTAQTTPAIDVTMPNLEDLVSAINPKQNYKLTVKILPKNMTGVNAGFKEIHASINKSFNKNGLRYSSLVNVSEISKVENLHNTSEPIKAERTNAATIAEPTNAVPFYTTPPTTFIKHIQDQQTKMDLLLKQHKQRIDEQLDHLKRERMNLDIISVKSLQEKTTETPEVASTTPVKPDPLLQMSNDDVSKLLASALLQLQSQNEFTPTVPTSTTTTHKPITKASTPKPQVNLNDKINNEILNQIHKNTEMLQTFLQKLTEKLSTEKEARKNSNERNPKYDYNPRFWKPFSEAAEPYPPGIDLKNNTRVPFPFVYAYQPPYAMNNFKHPVQHIPIANVIYHGHIHTDALARHSKSPKSLETLSDPKVEKDPKVAEVNQTKYFLDAIQDFKIPAVPTKKDINHPTVELVHKSTTKKT